MPRNFSPNDVGVWIDSSLGRFIGEEIQRIAEVEGWLGGFVEADNICCLECYTEAIEEAACINNRQEEEAPPEPPEEEQANSFLSRPPGGYTFVLHKHYNHALQLCL